MATRKERQQEKTRLKKKLRNPLVRRLLKSEMQRGSGTEVYRLDDDGTGNPMYFNISAMRPWAEENCEIFAMPIDFDRATRLVESGAIEPDHMMNHTIQNDLKPLLVCRGVNNADQIVDGAHRYVALCFGAAQFNINPPVPAYVLQPDEWRQFVLPRAVARASGIK